MRKFPSHQLQRVDAFFVAQQSDSRVRRVLLWLGLIVGSILWLPTVLPDKPAVDNPPLSAVDPFADVPPIGESTNAIQVEHRNKRGVDL